MPSSRRIMDFLTSGIPLGRYWGINVRLHFTFLIYAFYRVTNWDNTLMGIAYVIGLYLCILLHEFGHALAARWCDGEANDILLWPLGGLAYCRPAWDPTAHLITTVAGPFVTFVLWLVFWILQTLLRPLISGATPWVLQVWVFCLILQKTNLILLLFNLIPAFPMDGGRILRDTLWHWMRAETATDIAVMVSRVIALGGVAWAIYSSNYWLIFLALFVFVQTGREQQIVAFEAAGTYGFSLRERLTRARRQRSFRSGVRDINRLETGEAFHRCVTCGKTEHDSPTLDFRVCSECAQGQEYCPEHLRNHRHV